ncbi:hypothetical protein [Halocatena salina]|uniref:Uncharacterized protein n=1 Tax=Halocatena salina TaxID=2934340 RepID=A0A8U0A7P8_9EURY|nr:hypothetical protein [Halocatena salina]UPM45210.1 hypothetical protein MW046_17830 [Halocatena salina]
MPRPDQLVDITVDADIGAAPRDQFSTVALVGSPPTSEEPTDGFNNATRHTDAASVATAFGDGLDVHNAATEAFAEDVGAVWAIVLEATETTEVVGERVNRRTPRPSRPSLSRGRRRSRFRSTAAELT